MSTPRCEASGSNVASSAASGRDLSLWPDRRPLSSERWHLVLPISPASESQPVERVVFNAITKQSVLEAMQHPRDVDGALVDAYLARRALDYLVGFTLSPVLWRKLPGSRSTKRARLCGSPG